MNSAPFSSNPGGLRSKTLVFHKPFCWYSLKSVLSRTPEPFPFGIAILQSVAGTSPTTSTSCHNRPFMTETALITIVGETAKVLSLLFAVGVFAWNFIRARENEEFEIHDTLSNAYTDFLKQVIGNSDLYLLSEKVHPELNDEQLMRRNALFEILISIFERAYLLLCRKRMSQRRRQLWYSWEDFIRQWCRRSDFSAALPRLLEGEDPDFARYIGQIAQTEQTQSDTKTQAEHSEPSAA